MCWHRLNEGFVIIAVMVFMLIMSMVSLFTLEMNINNLKTMKYCHNMNMGSGLTPSNLQEC